MSDREFKIKTDFVMKQYSLSTPPWGKGNPVTTGECKENVKYN